MSKGKIGDTLPLLAQPSTGGTHPSTTTTPSPVQIPQLGLGTYLSPPARTLASCLAALEAGYRHIDTAQYYENEAEVGQALRQSGLPRADVFVTTKILKVTGSADEDHRACLQSVDKIDDAGAGAGAGGYVDLFLIHSPRGGPKKRAAAWQALERLRREGRARAIGVSNFGIAQIEELREAGDIWPPQVNQIELHPWNQQKEVVAYCQSHGILLQAYCPVVRNQKAGDPDLVRLAQKHGVTPNQVLVRWSLQKGFVSLPKSDDAGRIRLNGDVYGFALDEEDMAVLDGKDEGSDGALVMAVVND